MPNTPGFDIEVRSIERTRNSPRIMPEGIPHIRCTWNDCNNQAPFLLIEDNDEWGGRAACLLHRPDLAD